ncbi:hypothetical protein F5X96DRAFT_650368 [Biscogniauxia mediterranea]|nr:hypothetical protein F5X96DRAFT_650368 [Biscogniauxia mediterranea]
MTACASRSQSCPKEACFERMPNLRNGVWVPELLMICLHYIVYSPQIPGYCMGTGQSSYMSTHVGITAIRIVAIRLWLYIYV